MPDTEHLSKFKVHLYRKMDHHRILQDRLNRLEISTPQIELLNGLIETSRQEIAGFEAEIATIRKDAPEYKDTLALIAMLAEEIELGIQTYTLLGGTDAIAQVTAVPLLAAPDSAVDEDDEDDEDADEEGEDDAPGVDANTTLYSHSEAVLGQVLAVLVSAYPAPTKPREFRKFLKKPEVRAVFAKAVEKNGVEYAIRRNNERTRFSVGTYTKAAQRFKAMGFLSVVETPSKRRNYKLYTLIPCEAVISYLREHHATTLLPAFTRKVKALPTVVG